MLAIVAASQNSKKMTGVNDKSEGYCLFFPQFCYVALLGFIPTTI
jgi:hypothetical protein